VKQVGSDLRNVPIKTYTNVQPWGTLTEEKWRESFKKYSAGRPT